MEQECSYCINEIEVYTVGLLASPNPLEGFQEFAPLPIRLNYTMI